jgi:hypothetical protein
MRIRAQLEPNLSNVVGTRIILNNVTVGHILGYDIFTGKATYEIKNEHRLLVMKFALPGVADMESAIVDEFNPTMDTSGMGLRKMFPPKDK